MRIFSKQSPMLLSKVADKSDCNEEKEVQAVWFRHYYCSNFVWKNSPTNLPSDSSSSSRTSVEIFDDSASIRGDHYPDDVIGNEDPSEEENAFRLCPE